MAWGENVNTEEEAERIAAVREYFYEQVPHAEIRDSYMPGDWRRCFESKRATSEDSVTR